MAKNKIPTVTIIPTNAAKKYYFDNNKVEDLLLQYVWTGCTDIKLRDGIMENASELIRQIINTHNLYKIYPGQEESAFGDLFQTAWVQIEKTLYKYKARPHCSDCYNPARPMDSVIYDPKPNEYAIMTPKQIANNGLKCPQCGKLPSKIAYRGTSKVFNLWSQVARTVILAYIKKENRDHKNSDSYKSHLDNQTVPLSDQFTKLIDEIKQMSGDNPIHKKILDALQFIASTDDKPYERLTQKLIEHSNASKNQVSSFLKMIRKSSGEFSYVTDNAKPTFKYWRHAEEEDEW